MKPNDSLEEKRQRLVAVLAAMPSAAIALSGGVDSAVVAKAAQLALGGRAIAVTADSPSVARADLADARRIADAIGIRHVIIHTTEFENPEYTRNDGTRCYFCKSELYAQMSRRLAEWNVETLCSGANVDDLGDYRPGLIAAAEHAVRHPLQEAGLGKSDVRDLARLWKLPVWDKPASPCLASRIAPGVPVTRERTGRVEAAEQYLKSLGIHDARVRHHDGDLARIEVPLADVARLAEESVRAGLVACFTELGFRFITLDLAGFRSGSLNELVPLEVKAAVRESLLPVPS